LQRRASRIRDRIYDVFKLHFYVESAALLRLAGLPGAPAVRSIGPRQHTIEMDYIWGEDIRHSVTAREYPLAYEMIHQKFAALVTTREESLANEVPALIRRIVNCGVIPRDVHAANFIAATIRAFCIWLIMILLICDRCRVGVSTLQISANGSMRDPCNGNKTFKRFQPSSWPMAIDSRFWTRNCS
jgi:hypothetical protein